MLNFVSKQLRRIEHNGYIPLLIVTICIQGGIIASQFAATLFLTPSEIGVIRVIESALSIMILAGSVGAQTLSIRESAITKTKSQQLVALRNIYLIIALGASVVILGLTAFHTVWNRSILLDYILAISGIVLLTNAVRATSGFTQGVGLISKTYIYLTATTGIAAGITVFAASNWSVFGWIAGRYIGELLTLATLSAIVYKMVGAIPWRASDHLSKLKKLLHDGFKINTALVIKLTGDNLPVLIMAALKRPTDEIGFLGLAILAANSAMLPLAVLAQRAFPIMANHRSHPKELKRQTKLLGKTSLILSFLICAVLFTASAFFQKTLNSIYIDAFLLMTILCWTVPLKSMALVYGTNLMAKGQLNTSIKINAIEVILLGLLGLTATQIWGSKGAAYAIVLASLWSATAYNLAAKMQSRI
ncbi:MAG: hypothetical protein Q8S02_07910 [Hydrogenophaga sp.]|nr:hypothetical protein [Hydrogenophaga sp.]